MALGAWVPSALLYLKSQPPSYHFAGIHMLRNLGSTLYLTERNGEQEVITPAAPPPCQLAHKRNVVIYRCQLLITF